MGPKNRSAVFSWVFVFFVVLVVFSVSFTGYYYYNSQRYQLKILARNNLTSIANLKVDQIENWLMERRRDAEIICDNPMFFAPLLSWLDAKRSPALEKEIEGWMASFCEGTGYSGISLLDRNGVKLISYRKTGEESLEHEQTLIAKTIADNQIVFSDVSRDDKGNINMYFFVPIRKNKSPMGVLVLHMDPNLFLFPLIQAWPVPSDSAETLLVRREEDEVVFLNDLRHKKDAAFKLRFPANDRTLPASLTVSGVGGLIEGVDYRGIAVLAVGLPIPGTGWYIVSKVDSNEVYLPMFWIGARAAGLGALIIILLGAWLVVVKDKQSKVALQTSEARYRVLTETSPDCIKLFDLEGKLLYINRGGLNEHSLKDVEAARKWDYIGSIAKEDQEKFQKAIREAIQGKTSTIEVRHTLQGSNREVCLETIVPVFGEKGEITGVFGVSRDITELKRLINIRDEFVNAVSHELRTPMAIIREGVSQVIEGIHGPINEEQNRFLSTTLRSIDRLARIINNLLDISRLESGKMEAKKEAIDLAQLARETAAAFRPQVEKKNLELIENIPDVPVMLCIDRDEIAEVLINLLGNAVKFTDKGRIELSLIEKEREVECAVADTGRGIASGNLPKLFEKFTQFSRVAGSGEKGTGLGLAIVKALIGLHDGRISVDSEEGHGSKFTFTLPKKLETEEQQCPKY